MASCFSFTVPGGIFQTRQQQFDARALARPGVQRHEATNLAYERVDRSQTEPGAVAGLFGGEEGLKKSLPDGSFDANPGVGKTEKFGVMQGRLASKIEQTLIESGRPIGGRFGVHQPLHGARGEASLDDVQEAIASL